MDGFFYNLSFWVVALITVVSGLLVTTVRNLTHGIIFLVFFFLGIGGLYFLLQAEFLGLVQVIIYAGAISVLFAFVIMLTPGLPGVKLRQSNNTWAGVILGAVFLVVMLGALLGGQFAMITPDQGASASVADLGRALLSDYLLPFELVSVVLLVALIGAVVIAGRNREGREERHGSN